MYLTFILIPNLVNKDILLLNYTVQEIETWKQARSSLCGSDRV
jgi:hypothetical protein